MTLTDFYDAVARRADTDKTKISAAETRRVLSEAFKVLAALDAAAFAEVMAKGLANAKKKEGEAPAPAAAKQEVAGARPAAATAVAPGPAPAVGGHGKT